jgi:hypothetical protein
MITDAQIDAFFGPLELNSHTSKFTGQRRKEGRSETYRGVHNMLPRALVSEAAARRGLSNLGKREYAMFLVALPMLCLRLPTKAQKAANITVTDQILNNISKVLRGDFSSFDAVRDERIRVPQEAAGVITKKGRPEDCRLFARGMHQDS